MVDHNNPQSRNEEILIATIDGKEYNKLPQSRIEELLLELKAAIEAGGGGGGGTTNYNLLSNLPQINDIVLKGNKTAADLSLVLAEVGKGLSTNDYSNEEKAKVANLLTAIQSILDGSDIDSFGDVEIALLDKADISDLGTAAAKDSTNAVTSGSTDLVESGAVKDAIDAAVAAAYHHAGTKTVAQLTHDLLVAANEGNVYNITDSGTTTSDFIEGIGKTIDEGSNVGICKVGNDYKFDLLSGFVDTTNFVQKSQTAGLLKNDGTVNDEIEEGVSKLKSGFTNLDNEVNGDAVTYPYADVITINDAVPANLAECNVKIEPVQDLHGYDKPWVGGAGKNKLPYPYASDDGTYSTVSITTDWDGTININGTPNGDIYYTLTGNDFVLPQGEYIASVDNIPDNTRIVLGPTYLDRANKSRTITSDGTTPLNIYLNMNIHTGATNISMKPMLRLSTETDSTFAPYTNYCPITGHTEASVQRDGRNLWNGEFSEQNVFLLSDGTTASSTSWKVTDYIPVIGGESYTISYSTSNQSGAYACWYDENKNFIGSAAFTTSTSLTITIPANAKYVRASRKNDATEYQIELGQTATPYVPYAGKTYTIALGDTIYGGTVDFDTGVMSVTKKCVDLGSLDFTYDESQRFTVAISDMRNASIREAHFVTSCYLVIDDGRPYSQVPDFCAYAGWNGTSMMLSIHDSRYSDAATYKTAITGQKICYELATPLTVQLTPEQIQLLQGTNTLYASTGDISVTVNGVSGAIGAVQEQVNELAGEVTKVHSFSGTTSAYGVLSPSPSISIEDNFIIGAYGNGSYVVTPFIASSDNTWRFMVLKSNTMQPLAEQEATVHYVLVTSKA